MPPSHATASVPIGMWHQYGRIPQDTGIQIYIRVSIIDVAITVVVHFVTDFYSTWIGSGIVVIAVLALLETVTVTVLEVRDGGLEVQVGEDGATGFIKRSDLGRDRDEQRPDRFQVGGKVDALVIGFDRSKKPNFSIKARQIAEEKEAVAQFGSSDSGASLGDILGEALKKKED